MEGFVMGYSFMLRRCRRQTSIIQPSITAFKTCHRNCVPKGTTWHSGSSSVRRISDRMRMPAPIARPRAV